MIAKHRKAFSMLTAIFTMVIMATVSVLVMNMSGKVVKETYTQYQKEQAVLLAKSYTEFAIMAVMAHPRNNNCVNTINGIVVPHGVNIAGNGGNDNALDNGTGYNILTQISYIGANADIQNCNNRLGNPADDNNELNIIVDVYVRYRDITRDVIRNSPLITYHRRTLQKI